MTGAQIVTASDSLERWDHIANMVKEQSAFPATNYLDPPVGSNHFGLDGLKTIAYEMFEELGPDLVDAVLVPTSRGELIWGLFEGFRQLKAADLTTALPRLFAVEPFARISAVLGGGTVTGSCPGLTRLTSIDRKSVVRERVCNYV